MTTDYSKLVLRWNLFQNCGRSWSFYEPSRVKLFGSNNRIEITCHHLSPPFINKIFLKYMVSARYISVENTKIFSPYSLFIKLIGKLTLYSFINNLSFLPKIIIQSKLSPPFGPRVLEYKDPASRGQGWAVRQHRTTAISILHIHYPALQALQFFLTLNANFLEAL